MKASDVELLRAGAVVRPQRAAVNQRLGAINGAVVMEPGVDDAASISSVPSDESPPGSDSEP